MHSDHIDFIRYASPGALEKSINTLLGLIQGIAIDGEINSKEISFFENWLAEHEYLKDKHPYNEIVPKIKAALSDGKLAEEEYNDIIWLCEQLKSTKYYDEITADLQRFHAILGGVIADSKITEQELDGLALWMKTHDHLNKCYPFEEVRSLITVILKDRKVGEMEHKMLKSFFIEFTALSDEKTITKPIIAEEKKIVGLCSVNPDITIKGSKFCFTGSSPKFKRKDLIKILENLGGYSSENVTLDVDYLVIGADGNPFWAYACYGRKVERAVELRKSGSRIQLIHEIDFRNKISEIKKTCHNPQ